MSIGDSSLIRLTAWSQRGEIEQGRLDTCGRFGHTDVRGRNYGDRL